MVIWLTISCNWTLFGSGASSDSCTLLVLFSPPSLKNRRGCESAGSPMDVGEVLKFRSPIVVASEWPAQPLDTRPPPSQTKYSLPRHVHPPYPPPPPYPGQHPRFFLPFCSIARSVFLHLWSVYVVCFPGGVSYYPSSQYWPR